LCKNTKNIYSINFENLFLQPAVKKIRIFANLVEIFTSFAVKKWNETKK